MSAIVIGIITLILPFFRVFTYTNRYTGFVKTLAIVAMFHISLAIVTQQLGIFTYHVVLLISVLFAVIMLTTIPRPLYKKLWAGVTFDWVLISVLAISTLYLLTVHFYYSGLYTVDTTPEYQHADKLMYPYPYFSDEWYAIAFVKDAIEHRSLPSRNPLSESREPFSNLEMSFHSFIAEVVLLLGLDPLTHYTRLTIAFGILTITLLYILLRTNGIHSLPAAAASLSALFITSGANLPGMWNLIPLTLGIVFMLSGLVMISTNEWRYTLTLMVLTLLFYPPLFIFYAIALFIRLFQTRSLNIRRKKEFFIDALILVTETVFIFVYFYIIDFQPIRAGASLLYTMIFITALLATHDTPRYYYIRRILHLLFIAKSSLYPFFAYAYLDGVTRFYGELWDIIFYPTFISDAIPRYAITDVIPIILLIGAIAGIMSRNIPSWLLACAGAGSIIWMTYASVTNRFIIEYQRTVYVTSLFIILISGYGIEWIICYLRKKIVKWKIFMTYLQSAVLLLIVLLVPLYTKRADWQSLTLRNVNTDQVFLPAAPANRYLHPDDLRIFKDIRNAHFLSSPWKGTVIGVSTDNYPVTIKPGTITFNQHLYSQFMDVSCSRKLSMMYTYTIDYVYSFGFQCAEFESVDKSAEGLYLYKLKDA